MKHVVIIALGLGALLASVTAQAEIITYDYTGRVTGISDPNSDFVGATAGDLVFGVFSYDSQTPAAGDETIASYHFNDQPTNFTAIDVNGMHLENNGAYSVDVYNDFGLNDLVSIHGDISGSYARDGSTWTWYLLFESLSSTFPVHPLNSTDLPLTYSIADWSEGVRGTVIHTLQPSGPSSVLSFDFVDLRPRPVPESSTILLLFIGLARLGMFRRRVGPATR
jgi:hypothetical protein